MHSTFSLRAICALALLLAATAQAGTTPQPDETESEHWYNWTTDGVRHFVYEVGPPGGTSDPVVVLHGGWGAEHGYLVKPLLPVAAKYRLVFYDQRGSLRTPAESSTITLGRLVEDLEELRVTLGQEKLTLVTHSMGSALAYAYLHKYPDRVRGVVLVSAVLPASWAQPVNMELVREVWPDADASVFEQAAASFFNESVPNRFLLEAEKAGLIPESMKGLPAGELDLMGVLRGREKTRAWRIQFAMVNSCTGGNWREMDGGMAFYNQAAADSILADKDYASLASAFWPALKSYPGPIRLIMGTCDYVDFGPRVWPRLVEHIPDGKLSIVPSAGHAVWLDQPELLTKELFSALADIHEPGR